MYKPRNAGRILVVAATAAVAAAAWHPLFAGSATPSRPPRRLHASAGAAGTTWSYHWTPESKEQSEYGAEARLAVAERGVDAAEAWENAADALAAACGVATEQADAWLARAFGWHDWLRARRPRGGYLEEAATVPDPEAVRQDLRWLAEGPLGLGAKSEALR
eukprot:CAMPEP_0180802646 /NCGR_PEP_ID=MMETSP1038_2-20121128/60420_1 /TAXON_ID=632150 /ORGANISM="Azadinium spinosum, Strain 3D9" /LENGTH=161 /DNA_ID=CAMNT_0022842799 /DNA_START=30 /DNA_END=512 /DNA_ORIENTATION=+